MAAAAAQPDGRARWWDDDDASEAGGDDGHATYAAEWPHSSFHRYVALRHLAVDWVSNDSGDDGDFGERPCAPRRNP